MVGKSIRMHVLFLYSIIAIDGQLGQSFYELLNYYSGNHTLNFLLHFCLRVPFLFCILHAAHVDFWMYVYNYDLNSFGIFLN